MLSISTRRCLRSMTPSSSKLSSFDAASRYRLLHSSSNGGDGLKGMDRLHRVAATTRATPVSLQNLYHYGKWAARDPAQRLRNAQFLHNELQVRIAQRVVELEKLPLDMCQTKGVKDVVQWFTNYFYMIADHPYPTDEAGEVSFDKTLKVVLMDHNSVVESMARGALEVRRNKPNDFDADSQREIGTVLSRFYMARIGLRFLIEHNIQSRNPREGFSGIIQSACSPIECVEQAVMDASRICIHHLGESPEVQFVQVLREGRRLVGGSHVDPKNNITFTYVPVHLVYMLTEVLKNAMRATVEEHAKRGGALPLVKVVIVDGLTDVTIRISDEGGGIKRSDMEKVWSWLHTTATSPPEILDQDGNAVSAPGASNMPALAGYGVGLPLSRLYARYFGGELALKSLEGYGTDVYLHLSRLGQDCENLPDAILSSPAERDSTLIRGNSSIELTRS